MKNLKGKRWSLPKRGKKEQLWIPGKADSKQKKRIEK